MREKREEVVGNWKATKGEVRDFGAGEKFYATSRVAPPEEEEEEEREVRRRSISNSNPRF